MQIDTHGNGHGLNDLYILPDNAKETTEILIFLNNKCFNWYWSSANVEGNSWYGKQFIDVPFGESLSNELTQYLEAWDPRQVQ